MTELSTNNTGTTLLLSAQPGSAGFTLLETTIALLLMMIVALGSASLFAFSIYNNSGGADRATALAIAQESLETLRNARFDGTTTSTLLAGGTTTQTGIIRGGKTFSLTKTIDDRPATAAVDVDTTTTLKKITITVTAQSVGQGWVQGGRARVTLMTERAKADY